LYQVQTKQLTISKNVLFQNRSVVVAIVFFLFVFKGLFMRKGVFVYSKSEYTIESVSVSDRPFTRQLFTTTSDCAEILFIESSYRYLGRVRRWEWLVETFLSNSKKCDYFLWFSMEALTYPGFDKNVLSYKQTKPQLLYTNQ